MATSGRSQSAGGPGVLLVTATGLAAAAVALDAGFDLPAPLRAVLFAAWAAAVGVLGWGSLGRTTGRRREAWAAGGAAVALFGLVVVCVPGGVRAVRLAPPWSAPAAVRLTVTTGDPVVARGAGVTVACVCDRQRADDASTVRLEVRDDGGEVHTLVPAEEVAGVFSARLPVVTTPLGYRFLGGAAATAWHQITPADPVALTAASTLTAHPPAYAAGQFPVRQVAATEVVACLAGGRVEAKLAFDRPAVEIKAVWQPDGDEPSRPLTADLVADRMTATVSCAVPSSGRLVLTLTGDHDHRTDHTLPVAAVADHPPEYAAVAGVEGGMWAVRPDEVLDLTMAVTDDFWAAAPTLELLLGATPQATRAVPVILTSAGSGRFAGRLTVPLADHWQAGRVVARLRLIDSPRPAGVLFPADGWAEFTRAESAAPLAEQIVLAQRDRVAAQLVAVRGHSANVVTGDQFQQTAAAIRHVGDLEPLADELWNLGTAARSGGSGFVPAITAALETNRRLAVVRLDRLRLRELAATVREVAGRNPSAADVGRLRDRLAAVTAASPRLSAARVAAEERSLADAVEAAGNLADELDAAAARVIDGRAARLRPLGDRVGALAARLDAAETNWAVATRLVGAGRPAADRLGQATQLLRDARPADALPVLDAVGRQLTELAASFAQAADARSDPREAARQLVRWRADLDARPGPPPAAELVPWHAFARELAAVARAHNPTGGDTPDRIAKEFPTPTELKRRVTHDLREWAAVADVTRPPTELSALATRLETLPPPAESRRSRLAAAAVRRAVADVTAGRAPDATAGLIEARWRIELLAQSLDTNADPVAVLDEPPSARTGERLAVLAARVGVPPDLGDKPDLLRTAVRARIDGTDTDRRRVGDILRWWTSRLAIDAGHIRELLTLLDTCRLGEEVAAADVRRLAHVTRRPAEFKADMATALGRLRDGLTGHADVALASGADLDRPTAAQRLIRFDTGGHLPDHRLADAARWLATGVGTLARDVATASAGLQTDAQPQTVRAVYRPIFTRLNAAMRRPGVPEAVSARWQSVEQSWNAAGDVADNLRFTAAAFRQLPCVVWLAPVGERPELDLGRWLIQAEATLAGIGTGDVSEVQRAIRAAATALESAAR